jgi:hypothetical protein
MYGGDDSWGNGWTCAEKLSMDTRCGDAPGDKTRGQVIDEGRWPADKEVGIAWYFLFPKHPNVQTSIGIKIYAWPILGIGRAVAYMTVTAGQCFEEGSSFLREGMLAAAAGCV